MSAISVFYTFHSCVLDVVAVFLLVADGNVHDTREAFTNIGASSKDVVGKVLVTREAFNNIGSFFTDVDVTVHFPPGMPSINIGTQSWLMSLRYRALAMDVCTR